jgi:hypothetical protein
VSNSVLTDFGSYAQSAAYAMNAWPMLPYTGASFINIPQGVGQGNRIGNTIKIRKVMLSYVLRQNPYNLISNPQPQPLDVMFKLGHIKRIPGSLPTTGETNLLFQFGNTTVAPTGTTRDMIFNINKDYWNIKKSWVHKLGTSSYGGTGAQPDYQGFHNNDYKLTYVRRMDITKLVQKTIKFQDATTETTQGPNLFLMFQALTVNGAVASGAYTPANLSYFITIDYEDA